MLKKLLMCLLGSIAAYLAAAMLLGNFTVHASRSPDMGDINIFLLSNGVHTDIVLPVKHDAHDWRDIFPPSDLADPLTAELAEYIGIGWGSKRFYLETRTWADLRPSVAWEAVSGTGESAVRVSYYPAPLRENRHTVAVRITPAEYARLHKHITASLVRRDNGEALAITHARYGSNDAFYQANGRYHLFNTCNTWTNRTLKKSGLTAVIWTPFASDILDAYRH